MMCGWFIEILLPSFLAGPLIGDRLPIHILKAIGCETGAKEAAASLPMLRFGALDVYDPTC